MTREVAEYEHDAFGGDDANNARVNIEFGDGTGLVIRKSRGVDNISAREESAGMLRTYNRDIDHVEAILNDVSDSIPEDVERTARRILHLQRWIDERDVDWSRDSFLRTWGYRALRPESQELFLVEDVTGHSTRHDSAVFAFNDGDDRSEGEREEVINSVVEERVVDSLSDMDRHHYEKNDKCDPIEAAEIIEVESLAEAEAIVRGELFRPDDDGDRDESREQAALTAY